MIWPGVIVISLLVFELRRWARRLSKINAFSKCNHAQLNAWEVVWASVRFFSTITGIDDSIDSWKIIVLLTNLLFYSASIDSYIYGKYKRKCLQPKSFGHRENPCWATFRLHTLLAVPRRRRYRRRSPSSDRFPRTVAILTVFSLVYVCVCKCCCVSHPFKARTARV